jgi:beta-hydroxyacyl-ACP dehydratase FabZ
VTANEPFFQGHFPGVPIMPGVLILEAMAQCAGILFIKEAPDSENRLYLFGGIDKARFRRPVVPGDQLILEVEVIQQRSNSARVRGVAKVDGVTVAEAEILSVLGPKLD